MLYKEYICLFIDENYVYVFFSSIWAHVIIQKQIEIFHMLILEFMW